MTIRKSFLGVALGASLLVFASAFASPPSNDDFADAPVAASIPFSDSVETTDASLEPGEPGPSCGDEVDNTVWYRYSPSGDEGVRADTFGSDFDTVLAVYTGSSLSSLTQVACNDDTGGLQSRVTVQGSAGETYHFQGGGFAGDSGALVFNLTEPPPPPPNDDFADATVAATIPFSDGVDTTTASLEPGEHEPGCGFGVGRTVWYRYTPAAVQLLLADTFGSDFDTVLAVYVETGQGSLLHVACNDDTAGLQSEVLFLGLPDVTYHIQIGGYAGDGGTLTFNLGGTSVPASVGTGGALAGPGGANEIKTKSDPARAEKGLSPRLDRPVPG